jgi:hypothetical protein
MEKGGLKPQEKLDTKMAKYYDPILDYDPTKESTNVNTDSEGDVSGSGEEDSSSEDEL